MRVQSSRVPGGDEYTTHVDGLLPCRQVDVFDGALLTNTTSRVLWPTK